MVQCSSLTDSRGRGLFCQSRGYSSVFVQGANLLLPYLNKLMPILGNEVGDVLVANVRVVHGMDYSLSSGVPQRSSV
jgi:hypothetical protein